MIVKGGIFGPKVRVNMDETKLWVETETRLCSALLSGSLLCTPSLASHAPLSSMLHPRSPQPPSFTQFLTQLVSPLISQVPGNAHFRGLAWGSMHLFF